MIISRVQDWKNVGHQLLSAEKCQTVTSFCISRELSDCSNMYNFCARQLLKPHVADDSQIVDGFVCVVPISQ